MVLFDLWITWLEKGHLTIIIRQSIFGEMLYLSVLKQWIFECVKTSSS